MLKGIPTKNIDYNTETIPFTTFASVPVNTLSYQDTIKGGQPKVQQAQNQIALPKLGPTSEKFADSIFAKNELREKLIKAKELKLKSQPSVKFTNISTDTSSSNLADSNTGFQHRVGSGVSNNFLLNIANKNITRNFDTTLLTISKPKKLVSSPIQVKGKPIIIHEKTGFEGTLRKDASVDWLPIVLLVSLFVFSWMKLIYQKYVVQVVSSLVNYQVSLRLLRERNVLFRNMALGLNFVFSINAGLFLYYAIQYQDLQQIVSYNKFLNVLIYSTVIIIIYYLKTFICKVLGNIFMVKEQFTEYTHNIHLYNKNIGLFLFPVIILFPYITNDQIRPAVIYFGLAIVIGMSLLLIYRGFQIIMRNGVSIFYLILYLCAIEILPVLLLIKYSYTLI